VNREEKQRIVEALKAEWSRAEAGVVAHYRGLTVAEMSELRRRLRESAVSFRVVKNTLARRAAEGTNFATLEDLFVGPTAVASGDDAVAMAKTLADFAKEHEALEIKGGVLAGKKIGVEEVKALASLPPREVLLAKLLGAMQSPIAGLARTLAEVPASFVRVLAAVRDQKQGA